MTHRFADLTAPSLADFETLAAEALMRIPDPFRHAAQAVVIRVEDFAADEVLQHMETDAFALTGLYDGIPLTEKSTAWQDTQPDVIWLFRRPILDEWAERGNEPLGHLIAHVLVHELAHHFGWSDGDIAAIDPWWE